MPNADIGLILVLKSCHEVRKAASYSKGGKKTRKTTSGSITRSGKTGINPMISPTSTKNTGLGSFSLSITADKLIKTAKIKIMILKFSMLPFSN
jgi:hypothetical protein